MMIKIEKRIKGKRLNMKYQQHEKRITMRFLGKYCNLLELQEYKNLSIELSYYKNVVIMLK